MGVGGAPGCPWSRAPIEPLYSGVSSSIVAETMTGVGDRPELLQLFEEILGTSPAAYSSVVRHFQIASPLHYFQHYLAWRRYHV